MHAYVNTAAKEKTLPAIVMAAASGHAPNPVFPLAAWPPCPAPAPGPPEMHMAPARWASPNRERYDSFGARYYSSQLGRFMTPDPLGGDIYNPQSLNRYAYAWNNPATFTDPNGMYVCADSTKGHQCTSTSDKAFAASLARDLKSSDETARRAAAAYGKANEDNGVTVKFGDPGQGRDAVTAHDLGADPNNPGGYRANETVTLRNTLSGSVLDAAVGHEGSHLADAQAFAASITAAGAYNASLNLTAYDTETRAFHVTAAILASEGKDLSYGGSVLGSGISPAATYDAIRQILADPKGIYQLTPTNPGPALFPLLAVPH